MDYAALKAQLIDAEDNRKFPYVDTTGNITIGIGRNLTGKGLSESEILFLYNNDIAECLEDLVLFFPWWSTVGDVRQRAILDLRFNLGPARFRKFKTTLAFCENGFWKEAARAFRKNKKYFAQVGRRAERIARMLESGVDDAS